MTIQNVVLVGADGKLGPSILSALLSASLNVTILKRQSSTSPSDYPASVTVHRVPDTFPIPSLVPLLASQDAIICTTAGSQTSVQRNLALAAVQSHTAIRFIQADFGSCDSSSRRAQDLVPLFGQKSELRAFLDELAAQSGGSFTWSALVVGHFFDWSLGFLHLDLRARRAEVLDGGQTRFSITTLGQVGRATVGVLREAERTGNRVLFVQSCRVNQREIVGAFESATGEKWEVKDLKSDDYVRERKVKADEGDHEAIEDLVWVLGTLDGDWTTRDAFAMDLLGLKDENLDDVVRRIVKEQS